VPNQFDNQATPGAGSLNDLWLTTADGSQFWLLHNLPNVVSRDSPGTLHPHFSHDGKRLLWAERVRGNNTVFGEWALKLADFVVTSNGPQLQNIQTFQPGEQKGFYESHGFTNDDKAILFTGNLERGQSQIGLDIYIMDLATQQVSNLTHTPNDWDEHADLSPDGTKIVWMSSTGIALRQQPFQLKTEFWIMNLDGSGKRQLTHFNTSGDPQFLSVPAAVPADSTWSPDGTQIIALVIDQDPNGPRHDQGKMVRLTC